MKPESDNLAEALWRQQISAAEQAELRHRPELAADAALTAALAALPDAPVPSNFAARVLHALDREEAVAARTSGWAWNWRALLPRVAFAAGLLLVGTMLFQRHELNLRHQLLAQKVVSLAAAQPVPSVEALDNFEAIQRMGQSARADGELLAALQ